MRFFYDDMAKALSIQGASLMEVLYKISMETADKNGRFKSNYSGFYLLALMVEELARASNDLQIQCLARWVQNVAVLRTMVAPDYDFTDDEIRVIEQLTTTESLNEYNSNVRKMRTSQKLGPNYFPRILARFHDIEGSLRKFVFGEGYNKNFTLLPPDTLFLTMGSCFAENIAKFLSSIGLDVVNFSSAEEASPSTFPEFVDAVQSDEQYAGLRRKISAARSVCVIYPAGVGETIGLLSGKSIAASDLKENLLAVRSIKKADVASPTDIANFIELGFTRLLAINESVQLICTVSPVPIEATFQKGLGIIPSNSYAKASLLMGVRTLCARNDAIRCFPSYEIVKDWAPLSNFQPFAKDDGQPRHVSKNLVLIICLSFIKYFLGDTAYVAAIAKISTGGTAESLRGLLSTLAASPSSLME